MFGLIVKFATHEGKRDEFIQILSQGMRDFPGCHSYIYAVDPSDETSVWVTEIWDSVESHDAAVGLPRSLEVIARAKPLMTGRDLRVVTEPIAGQGL